VLFDQLTPVEASLADWRISPADELLQMPFAALVPSETSGRSATYLAELHSVTLIPGAMSLGSPATVPGEGRFLAVGDPIYNVADPRWQSAQS
jgi:hypothetical protein